MFVCHNVRMSQQESVPYQPRLSNAQIFGHAANFDERYVKDRARLAELVQAWKTVGHTIVLTMGTFDVAHIGHFLYLEQARSQGDILIVGVDSDEKVRKRKGPDRPVVSEEERAHMLAHLRHVDVVTLKHSADPRWDLIKTVKPNVLVATEETYDDTELEDLKQYCGKVVVLEPQATTSTTAKIRRMQVSGAQKMTEVLIDKMQSALDELKAGTKQVQRNPKAKTKSDASKK